MSSDLTSCRSAFISAHCDEFSSGNMFRNKSKNLNSTCWCPRSWSVICASPGLRVFTLIPTASSPADRGHMTLEREGSLKEINSFLFRFYLKNFICKKSPQKNNMSCKSLDKILKCVDFNSVGSTVIILLNTQWDHPSRNQFTHSHIFCGRKSGQLEPIFNLVQVLCMRPTTQMYDSSQFQRFSKWSFRAP